MGRSIHDFISLLSMSLKRVLIRRSFMFTVLSFPPSTRGLGINLVSVRFPTFPSLRPPVPPVLFFVFFLFLLLSPSERLMKRHQRGFRVVAVILKSEFLTTNLSTVSLPFPSFIYLLWVRLLSIRSKLFKSLTDHDMKQNRDQTESQRGERTLHLCVYSFGLHKCVKESLYQKGKRTVRLQEKWVFVSRSTARHIRPKESSL